MGTTSNHAGLKRDKKREIHFPGSKELIFDPRAKTTKGYAQVPRVVPLLARLINDIGGSENAGSLYQVLWSRDWGQGIIEVRNRGQFLYEAGFKIETPRIERTWHERIKILTRFGFIKTANHGVDVHGFILLVDPHIVALELETKPPEHFDEAKHHEALLQWMPQFKSFCEEWGIDLDGYRTRLAKSSTPEHAKGAS